MGIDNELDALALVRETLRTVMAEEGALPTAVDALSLDSRVDEIEMDSVRFLEVVGLLEERIGRDLPDELISRVESLRDLTRLLLEA